MNYWGKVLGGRAELDPRGGSVLGMRTQWVSDVLPNLFLTASTPDGRSVPQPISTE